MEENKRLIFSKRSLTLKPLHPQSRVSTSWMIYKSRHLCPILYFKICPFSANGSPAHSLVLGCRRGTGLRKPHHVPQERESGPVGFFCVAHCKPRALQEAPLQGGRCWSLGWRLRRLGVRVRAFLVAQIVKNLPTMQIWVWSLGQEDSLEKKMATHSSIHAWRIPWTEEPGGLQSMGSQRVRHD